MALALRLDLAPGGSAVGRDGASGSPSPVSWDTQAPTAVFGTLGGVHGWVTPHRGSGPKSLTSLAAVYPLSHWNVCVPGPVSKQKPCNPEPAGAPPTIGGDARLRFETL